MSKPDQPTEQRRNSIGQERALTSDAANNAGQEPSRITSQHQSIVLPSVATLTAYGELDPSARGTEANILPPPRAFGFQSILNPTFDGGSSRTSARATLSPGRSASAAFTQSSAPVNSPRVRKRGNDASSPGQLYQGSELRPGRRLLTPKPKSPAMRSSSQGTRGSPSNLSQLYAGTDPRIYTAEPGETLRGTIPPLPPVPQNFTAQEPATSLAGGEPLHTPMHPYSYPQATYPSTTTGHTGSPAGSSSIGVADREGGSPYHSSVSDPSSSTNRIQTVHGNQLHGRSPTRTYGAGQPPYQMELTTESGPMILPVEVDVQQASKLADEKRKRNAGASARFRQRRKEKEVAASGHISDLQRQVRELTEDRDFYLNERNMFRDMFARTPGASLPPRPSSPRLRRSQSQVPYAAAHLVPSPSIEYAQPDPSIPPPTQRRRTSSYRPSYASTPAPLAPGNYANTYPGPPASSYLPPQPSMTSARDELRGRPSGPPPAQVPHSAYNPLPAQPHTQSPSQVSNIQPSPYERPARDNQRYN